MKFSFLVENKTDNPGIMAEHGLSIYIETSEKRILFDGGATNLLVNNCEAMGIDLGNVDLAVVSHGHYDHTGGFPAFHRINPSAPIYIHRNALRVSYGTEGGSLEKGGTLDNEPCSIAWSDEELKELSQQLYFTDGPVIVTENIRITGTVPAGDVFTPTENFYVMEQGKPVIDDMSHEQCLVIREPEGLYIFSGCSHRGVINALNAGKAMFPGERVAVLVAGMHLYSAAEEDRSRVIDEILRENMDRVMPVHCTGIDAICQLKSAMGSRCTVATAGDVFTF